MALDKALFAGAPVRDNNLRNFLGETNLHCCVVGFRTTLAGLAFSFYLMLDQPFLVSAFCEQIKPDAVRTCSLFRQWTLLQEGGCPDRRMSARSSGKTHGPCIRPRAHFCAPGTETVFGGFCPMIQDCSPATARTAGRRPTGAWTVAFAANPYLLAGSATRNTSAPIQLAHAFTIQIDPGLSHPKGSIPRSRLCGRYLLSKI